MTTLTIHIPGRVIPMTGDIHEGNLKEVAETLDRQLPLIAAHYGRVAAIVTRDGVSHIIASMRSPACRS
jgi:hypothetical protein